MAAVDSVIPCRGIEQHGLGRHIALSTHSLRFVLLVDNIWDRTASALLFFYASGHALLQPSQITGFLWSGMPRYLCCIQFAKRAESPERRPAKPLRLLESWEQSGGLPTATTFTSFSSSNHRSHTEAHLADILL
jgi:hypothetical protein